MSEIRYKPIGTIHSPFKDVKGMPIQPAGAEGIKGIVEVFKEYCAGLKDIEGFSHIILIYHFHLSSGFALVSKPFLDNVARGIFAIRGPARPNPVGISVVRVNAVENCTLYILRMLILSMVHHFWILSPMYRTSTVDRQSELDGCPRKHRAFVRSGLSNFGFF